MRFMLITASNQLPTANCQQSQQCQNCRHWHYQFACKVPRLFIAICKCVCGVCVCVCVCVVCVWCVLCVSFWNFIKCWSTCPTRFALPKTFSTLFTPRFMWHLPLRYICIFCWSLSLYLYIVSYMADVVAVIAMRQLSAAHSTAAAAASSHLIMTLWWWWWWWWWSTEARTHSTWFLWRNSH